MKGDSYRKAFAKYMNDRNNEIIQLKAELRELYRLVEFLCHEVFKDESS